MNIKSALQEIPVEMQGFILMECNGGLYDELWLLRYVLDKKFKAFINSSAVSQFLKESRKVHLSKIHETNFESSKSS